MESISLEVSKFHPRREWFHPGGPLPDLFLNLEAIGLDAGFPKTWKWGFGNSLHGKNLSGFARQANDGDLIAMSMVELMAHVVLISMASELGLFGETGFDDFSSRFLRNQPFFRKQTIRATPVEYRDHANPSFQGFGFFRGISFPVRSFKQAWISSRASSEMPSSDSALSNHFLVNSSIAEFNSRAQFFGSCAYLVNRGGFSQFSS
jgi:hypothetical protein